jgi:hypothetical protein
VAADTARTGVPQLIAESLREDAAGVQAAAPPTAAVAADARPEPVATETRGGA